MTIQRPRVVFCTSTGNIIDFVRDGAGETDEAAISRLKGDYGTALSVMPAEEAQTRYETRFKTPIEEISAADFDDALNVLPPVAWTRSGGAESFKMSERLAGRVTTIYVAIGGKYFRFHDDIRTPHATCCERALAFVTAAPNTPVAEVKP